MFLLVVFQEYLLDRLFLSYSAMASARDSYSVSNVSVKYLTVDIIALPRRGTTDLWNRLLTQFFNKIKITNPANSRI